MSKDFITIQEAADLLGKSAQTVRRMIKRGELNAKRVKTPQGFHYVIPKEDIEYTPQKPQKAKVETVEEAPLYNSNVENPTKPEPIAKADPPTSQTPVLTNQHEEKAVEKPINTNIDKRELIQLLERHHKENLFLLKIIDRLQVELDHERRRPKSFIAYFFDWLTHRK